MSRQVALASRRGIDNQIPGTRGWVSPRPGTWPPCLVFSKTAGYCFGVLKKPFSTLWAYSFKKLKKWERASKIRSGRTNLDHAVTTGWVKVKLERSKVWLGLSKREDQLYFHIDYSVTIDELQLTRRSGWGIVNWSNYSLIWLPNLN